MGMEKTTTTKNERLFFQVLQKIWQDLNAFSKEREKKKKRKTPKMSPSFQVVTEC